MVKSVEMKTPPIMATAMGIRVSAPGPKDSAAGTAPAMVATDVITIGRRRMGQVGSPGTELEFAL